MAFATLRPPSPAALRLLCLVTLTALGLPAAACSYSWEIGSGGAAPTTSSAGGGGAGGASGTTTTAPDCASLKAALGTARVAAQACSYAGAQAQGECAQKITDECGCRAFVKAGASPEAKAFSDAVQAFASAGCAPTCAACSALQTGACLQAGAVIHCVP